jgi:hypothetical protein
MVCKQIQNMRIDYRWDSPASQYEDLYQSAVAHVRVAAQTRIISNAFTSLFSFFRFSVWFHQKMQIRHLLQNDVYLPASASLQYTKYTWSSLLTAIEMIKDTTTHTIENYHGEVVAKKNFGPSCERAIVLCCWLFPAGHHISGESSGSFYSTLCFYFHVSSLLVWLKFSTIFPLILTIESLHFHWSSGISSTATNHPLLKIHPCNSTSILFHKSPNVHYTTRVNKCRWTKQNKYFTTAYQFHASTAVWQ